MKTAPQKNRTKAKALNHDFTTGSFGARTTLNFASITFITDSLA